MFQAGSDFGSKTPEEIFYQDFKTFSQDGVEFGVGQLSAMTQEELEQVRDKLLPYLRDVLVERKIEMVFVMLTNIIEETTYLICAGEKADDLFQVGCIGLIKAIDNFDINQDVQFSTYRSTYDNRRSKKIFERQ